MFPSQHQAVQGTILFLAGPLAGRSFPVIPPVTTLGRDPRNTIVVPDPTVSPFHARLLLTGSGWIIELLAPRNVLMVNQAQRRKLLIRDQDVIRLGSGTVFRCAFKTNMPYNPQPLVPPPQQVRSGLRLSRRMVLIGGAVLAGGLFWKFLSSRSSSLSHSSPFQHVALGTHLVTYQGHVDSVLTVAWSPDSALIASGAGTLDLTARVWNALDGTTVYTQQPYYPSSLDGFISLAWSPDGTRIVTSGNGGVHTWDATDGGQDTTLMQPSTLAIIEVKQVVWSPDGTRIAGACDSNVLTAGPTGSGTVLVWDAGSAKALTYDETQNQIWSVAWSPDNQRIAAAGFDNTVQVLSVGNWQSLFSYQGHTSAVTSVAWSPDGTHIASASYDQTVQVWDATNGNALSTFRGHTQNVLTVAWSPDSQRLASGGDDWTVQVWNAVDASPIYVYKGHSDGVNQVAWSPDGTRIASASNDKTVQVWGAG